MGFADHFSSIAARYAAYRPRYPQVLTDALADRCARCELAWDAGCGSGQLSTALAERFAQVIATDASATQLAAAASHPRVAYRQATAEASGVPDGAVDLAVAAQAAHWFDWPRYVAEVARVTRPGALVALVSYDIVRVAGDPGDAIARYYAELAPYWPPERRLVEDHYRTLVWPWPAVEPPAIDMAARWTREELFGYATTWSASVRLVDACGPGRLEALHDELAAVWPGDEPRDVRWPLTIKLARR